MDNSFDFEKRLEDMRQEAREKGAVRGDGVRASGGPVPPQASESLPGQGYFGLPILKPPVWEWMIAVYFFIGGLAGMSGLVALGALLKNQFEVARVAMWSAGIGGILSPILLAIDLGRPVRFLYMLRVFKYQSPMSVGSWIVFTFGVASIPGWGFTEWHWQNMQHGNIVSPVYWLAVLGIIGSGVVGVFLSTYTGALIAVTAVPAWNLHRVLLPFHFGVAGLGSATAVLQLAGFRQPALAAILFFAATAQTLVMFWLEAQKHGAADRALHEGKSGWILRTGEALEGPLPLILALLGAISAAAALFLMGALLTRFGWLYAGRFSACDVQSVLASQRGVHPLAQTQLPYSINPTVASAGSLKSEFHPHR